VAFGLVPPNAGDVGSELLLQQQTEKEPTRLVIEKYGRLRQSSDTLDTDTKKNIRSFYLQ
jgi:hypothetical protein